jgi:ribonuclease G
MTRQNVTEGVREIMTRHCPTCDGEGVIRSEETIAISFERRLRDVVRAIEAEALLLRINPRVSAVFTRDGAKILRQLEQQTGKWFHFEGSEGLPLDHFAITMEGTRDEVAERALPFREGDEVLVTIVEPHMYNVDDAVAKIDGYIVSVTGGGRHVGEKRLVRIDEVGRTAAVATLVANGSGPADSEDASADAASADADGVESVARRRGRRGGRRRSRAKADVTAGTGDDD